MSLALHIKVYWDRRLSVWVPGWTYFCHKIQRTDGNGLYAMKSLYYNMCYFAFKVGQYEMPTNQHPFSPSIDSGGKSHFWANCFMRRWVVSKPRHSNLRGAFSPPIAVTSGMLNIQPWPIHQRRTGTVPSARSDTQPNTASWQGREVSPLLTLILAWCLWSNWIIRNNVISVSLQDIIVVVLFPKKKYISR